MATHTVHPDSHEYGLADGCPRCEEHSRYPFEGLGDRNLSALVDRATKDLPARSDNEAAAMKVVSETLWRAEKLRSLGVRL